MTELGVSAIFYKFLDDMEVPIDCCVNETAFVCRVRAIDQRRGIVGVVSEDGA